MKRWLELTSGVVLLMGAVACFAQNPPIPSDLLQSREQASPRELAPDNVFSCAHSYETPSVVRASSSSASGGPTHALRSADKRRLGVRYILLNGLDLGMAGLDVALTQRCIDQGRCREGNPLMPQSLAGRISISAALVGFGALVSAQLKKKGYRFWWMPPVAGIATHSAGAVTGFLHP
jgi:hypothetical protein